MDKDHLVVYCTCPSRQVAEHIASALVDEYLAACANIVSGITSVYRWQDQVQHDSETLLIIKTRAGTYPAMEARIRTLHPYEVPEIIALPICLGAADYLAWINASVTRPE